MANLRLRPYVVLTHLAACFNKKTLFFLYVSTLNSENQKNIFQPCIIFKFQFNLLAGIYPDVMHITHLALGVDALSSVMLDVVDHPTLVAETTKQKKLDVLWENYREWCEGGRLLFHLIMPPSFFD